jgi:hypothetical protein
MPSAYLTRPLRHYSVALEQYLARRGVELIVAKDQATGRYVLIDSRCRLYGPARGYATMLDAVGPPLTDDRPYGEWCRKPEACRDKGYCPLDPTCGD